MCSAVSYFSTREGSIIGAGRLSFRVRDGTGRFPAAMDRRNSIHSFLSVNLVFWWWGAVCTPDTWCVGVYELWLRGQDVRLTELIKLWCLLVVVSFRPVSASSLHLLLGFQVWSINPVVCGGPYPSKRVRSLVLEGVSRLDAFSGYPVRTWLSSGAPGGTTGIPEVRPSRSSRTRDRFPQASDARGG